MSIQGAAQWLDDRLGWSFLADLAKHKMVPVHRHSIWYYLGGITLFLFIVQVSTGILLMLYYRPSADEAFESVQFIVTQVQFGWLVRSIHSWSANLMVGAAFVHLFSVFFLRAYRKPREITWFSGVILLLLSLGFGFSGYLLPWNELAFFATRVGTDIAGAVPFVGEWVRTFLRGGDEVTGATLSRFYGWHVAILPAIASLLLGIHLYLVQRHGMSRPAEAEGPRKDDDGKKVMPFVPNFLLRDIFGWTVALALLAALAAYAPWELGVKADPFAPAPANIKPEWYFMFMFETLKLVPGGEIMGIEYEAITILSFNFGALLLLAVPFMDDGTRKRGRILKTAGWIVLAFMVTMTAIGYHSIWPAVITVGGILLVWFAGSRGFMVLLLCGALGLAASTGEVRAEGAKEAAEAAHAAKAESACVKCHKTLGDVAEELYVPTQAWVDDVHADRGLSCTGCHGGDGDPALFDDGEASMSPAKGFVGSPSRTQVAKVCGACHANADFMKQFNPDARVDILAEYATSGHGKAIASGDDRAATCIDCHGIHGIREVTNPASPAYPTNVANTCAHCHEDASLMEAYGHDTAIVSQWKGSVHAAALLEKNDLSAPTCNDCHGNHGAAPPGVESLAFVCGSCHGREADLFRNSWKLEVFEAAGASECVTCHGNHDVQHPTDALIGTGPETTCSQCHEPGDDCDKASIRIRDAIDRYDSRLHDAREILERAERAGMEVSEPLYKLDKEGVTGLVDTRALIHSFDVDRMVASAEDGIKVADEAQTAGEEAMEELGFRRKGLAFSLVFIAILLVALYAKIRQVDAG